MAIMPTSERLIKTVMMVKIRFTYEYYNMER